MKNNFKLGVETLGWPVLCVYFMLTFAQVSAAFPRAS